MPITNGSLSRPVQFGPGNGWVPLAEDGPQLAGEGSPYRKPQDCHNSQSKEMVEAARRLLDVVEMRELRIRLNPATATRGDVLFLLLQLAEARRAAPPINVKAWLAANQRPPSGPDWIAALTRPYCPPV